MRGRGGDFAAALLTALLIHIFAGLCLGRLIGTLDRSVVYPEFRKGLSSIELDFVSVSRPLPLLPPEPEVVSETLPEEKPPEEEVVEEPVMADNLEKGIEDSRSIFSTDERPRYPLGSRMRGEEGAVTLKVIIGASGRVTTVEVLESSGYQALDKAGIKAATRASFRNENGQRAVSTETTVTFRFRLID